MAGRCWSVLKSPLALISVLIVGAALRNFTVLLQQSNRHVDMYVDQGQHPLLARFTKSSLTSSLSHTGAKSPESTASAPPAPAPISNDEKDRLVPLHNASSMASSAVASIAFIHVGKTGGETIKWRLRVICDQRKSIRKKVQCLEQFEEGESELSKHTMGYFHCNAVRPKWSLANATAYLISVRDPVDRIVSWFQYMHPRNCLAGRPSAACNLKKTDSDGYGWGLDFFEKCFGSIDEMVRSLRFPALVGSSIGSSMNCSDLATRAVEGNGPVGPSNHLYFNYRWYANRTIVPYQDKPIFVVRKEALWQDMQRIEGLLGGNSTRSFETEGPIITHGSELFPHVAHLSDDLAPFLCCSIRNEISLYASIIQRSINLRTTEKFESVQRVLDKCDADSVELLMQQCS